MASRLFQPVLLSITHEAEHDDVPLRGTGPSAAAFCSLTGVKFQQHHETKDIMNSDHSYVIISPENDGMSKSTNIVALPVEIPLLVIFLYNKPSLLQG